MKIDTTNNDFRIFDDAGNLRGRFRSAGELAEHLALAIDEIDSLNRERDELRQSNRVLSHQLDRRADGMDDLTQLLRSRLVEANQQRDEALKAARWMLPFVALDGAGYGRVHEACQRWPWLEDMEAPE